MGDWIKRHEQWLPRTIKREPPAAVIEQPEETAVQAEEQKNDPYGVTFYPLRCPKCKSKKIKTYACKPPVRYHKCKTCGLNFKSREKEA